MVSLIYTCYKQYPQKKYTTILSTVITNEGFELANIVYINLYQF